ncbi:MAG: efflux RND transporter periplasmic adaptor subunit [Methylibium sp.]|uniref:efflux RND transporter periplasmic adaptor subunit n=1 Tax=Methylibium sp. TaxID=2067992 RepID=UPI0017A2EA59|nr:efflux RND transporter periplasmic adaptor subunit [Methylibium sp.]MBA3597943.1 efflux RND transporter periplasmic adaptor subunit [Methylibium sp.]
MSAAGLVLLLTACSKPAPEPEPVRAVRTLTVANAATESQYQFAAEVRARVESQLGFRVGGKIVKRSAELGDSVKAGEVLAQLDPQDLRLSRDSARAALVAAQSSYELSAADHKRYQELLAQGFISAAELERRSTELQAAKSTLAQARAEAAMQGNQARYATLVADASGVVTGIEAEPGQVVAAGTPVLRLAHDGARDVVFSVPEDRLGLVRELAGQKAALQVRLWGASRTLPATVREVAAATDPVTRTVLVKAGIGNASVTLGQTATVLIDTRQQGGAAIKLPLSALVEAEGKTSVWLLDAQTMTVQPQPVQVQSADGNSVVIASGLVPGQEVVTAGVHVLAPGQKVKRFAGVGAAAPMASADATAAPSRGAPPASAAPAASAAAPGASH